MKTIAALPVLIAFLVGALPARAWTWPVEGPVLRSFSFEGGPYAAGQHRGIDVGAPAGTPVRAPAGGDVTFAGSVPRYGRTVTITTSDGYAVTLVHLGETAVALGDSVDEGAQVGTVGPSGEPEVADRTSISASASRRHPRGTSIRSRFCRPFPLREPRVPRPQPARRLCRPRGRRG